MKTLILHPTPAAQWHALVQEAKVEADIPLSEDLESYLVFLLMRFIDHSELAHSPLALDFLKSLEQLGRSREALLREVGDNCLLVAGFFPGRARRRRLRISYYVKLGQSAYGTLSYTHHEELAKLFSKLCAHFVGMMDVLNTIRTLKENVELIDLIEAEELWNDTHSAYAFKLLKKRISNPLFRHDFSTISHQKH